MFIRRSTHLQIVKDLHYSYGRKEYYQEKKIQKLQAENENLRIRLNKALDINDRPKPSRSESLTRKIQSHHTPYKEEALHIPNITNAVLTPSLLSNEDIPSSCSSDDSYQPSCSS